MSEWSLIITIVGTVASIIGAVLSMLYAKRSKKDAAKAIEVRNEFISHRQTSELAQLQFSVKKAIRSMEKYGPGSNSTRIMGASPTNDAAFVRDFLILLQENKSHFKKGEKNEAEDFCNITYSVLDRFSKSGIEELCTIGKEILLHLSSISSNIKDKLDNERENIGRILIRK